jgi:hypothetical protein
MGGIDQPNKPMDGRARNDRLWRERQRETAPTPPRDSEQCAFFDDEQ